MWLIELFFLTDSANVICRGTDISKYFRESLGIRDNESRLYFFQKGSCVQKCKHDAQKVGGGCQPVTRFNVPGLQSEVEVIRVRCNGFMFLLALVIRYMDPGRDVRYPITKTRLFNILKISPQETESFQVKILIFFLFLPKI